MGYERKKDESVSREEREGYGGREGVREAERKEGREGGEEKEGKREGHG